MPSPHAPPTGASPHRTSLLPPRTSLLSGLLALACGCSAPDEPANPSAATSTRQDIGPDGGIVQIEGVTLTIPEDALTETVTITMAVVDAPPDAVTWSPAVDFGPDGLSFLAPAEVLFPVTGEHPDAVVWWSSASGLEVLPTTTRIGAAQAWVSHFSHGYAGPPPADSDTAIDTDLPADTSLPADTHGETDTDGGADTDTDGLRDTSADSDTDGGADTDTDRLRDTSADSDTDPPADSDLPTDTAPDTTSGGTGYADTGWVRGPPSCHLDSGDASTIGWPDTGISAPFPFNGDDDDWPAKGRLITSSPGPSRATLGWDLNQLLIGLSHPDLAAASPDRYVVVYIGSAGDTMTRGLSTGAQRPTLAEPARWLVRWRTDGASLELWRAVAHRWKPEPLHPRLDARATPGTVEIGIPFEVLGCDTHMTATWMIVDAATDLTYAASPAHALVDGQDPDVTCAYTFNPNAYNGLVQLWGDCGQPKPPRDDTGDDSAP